MNERRIGRLPLAPIEGWLTVALVVVMAVCLAWSLDSARWVLGRATYTSWLPYASIGGVLWGFISAKAGWPRWLAHLLGAVFAALLLPIAVGGVLLNGDFSPGPAFVVTASRSVEAYLDLTVRGLRFTEQWAHFMLVLGILCWGTGQFASYAVFGHHRPLNAVILSGLALVLNMSITRDEQLGILIWFSLAAMFLLIRLHALDERSTWLRHRLGDAGSLSGPYLRAGSMFVGVAVLGALVLTATASSAPLNGLGRGLDDKLVQLTRGLEAVFRGGGAGTRITTVDFQTSTSITGQWVTDDTPVLTIKVPDAGQYHWRAVAYDAFDGRNWSVTTPTDTSVAAGGSLLAGTLDDPGTAGRRQLTVSVHELNFDPPNIFAADAPLKVSTDTTVTLLGQSPAAFIGTITKSSATDYSVTSEVPIDYAADPVHGLTGNQLVVAGTDYPAAVRGYYLQLDPIVKAGPATLALRAAIMSAHPAAIRDPYDYSRAVEEYLKSEGGFHYQADVSSVDCRGAGIVECFAQNKVGYCEYYASTMVVLLRLQGIPARLAEGFQPSAPDTNGIETIKHSASHAWVEVYFPGYGWQTFDPTGGGHGAPDALPAGPVVTPRPTSSIKPLGSLSDDLQRTIRPPVDGGNQAGSIQGSGGAGGGYILVGLLLIAIMAALVVVAWQRGPRQAQEPDRVYGGIVGLARRLGFGPRPNQTVYEYAGGLGDILPSARPDLHTVAVAKVEVAYGRRTLGPDRIDALNRAQRHLRIVLLGLIFHRSERRARRRRR